MRRKNKVYFGTVLPSDTIRILDVICKIISLSLASLLMEILGVEVSRLEPMNFGPLSPPKFFLFEELIKVFFSSFDF